MQPTSPGELIALLRDMLQIVASLAVVLVVLWLALRGLRGNGNPVQLDIDLQVHDIAASSDLVGELLVVVHNLGPRTQKLFNLFIEVRPSRHINANGLPLVPVVNIIHDEDYPLALAPGVRQTLTWTFEIPRNERLLRATALISTGRWINSEAIPTLSQQYFPTFGTSARHASRLFDVLPPAFPRF